MSKEQRKMNTSKERVDGDDVSRKSEAVGSNSAVTERPTPQTDPWRWMETWMLAHDKATGSTKGKEVMGWVWQADTGC